MWIKRNLLLIFSLIIVLSAMNMVSFAGTLLEDFSDGNIDGWKRSPQNEKNNKIFGGIVDGALMFDPKGQELGQTDCQMNFVGTPKLSNVHVREWTDYEFEVDIKYSEHTGWELLPTPGGIRARVDLDSGGHLRIWLYPFLRKMILWKNPFWNIHDGLVNLGEVPIEPPDVGKFHKLMLSCNGDTIKVFYDGEEKITAKDDEHKSGTIALDVCDKVVYFDNIKVTGAQIPNVNMSSPVEPAGKFAIAWGEIKGK